MSSTIRDIDAIVAAFDQAWNTSPPPSLEAYLPAENTPNRLAVLQRLILIDLERRFDAGQRVRLEHLYLAFFPELRQHTRVMLALLSREWELRLRYESTVEMEEFIQRFPEYQEQFTLLFPTSLGEVAGSHSTLTLFPPPPLRPILTPIGYFSANNDPTMHELLGRGGMGEVYRGYDATLARDLAVKVLPESLLRERPELAQRFATEAQIAGQLQHPGVVPVYQMGRLQDGRPYFTMKLVRGRTLREEFAERSTPLENQGRFLGIFEQVCQTMSYAHSKQVIHRDLKPENIMLGAFGEVQVMDWGLAKILEPVSGPQDGAEDPMILSSSRSTDRTGQAGTPGFMAPEQGRGESDRTDTRADVFGLGGILCVLLTGKPPFVSESGGGPLPLVLAADLTGAHRRLDACGADAELVALCKECLGPCPEDRPEHAGMVATRLGDYQAKVRKRLELAERERTAAEAREQEWAARAAAERRAAVAERRRRRGTAMLAGTFLVLGTISAGVAWYAWTESRRAEGLSQQATTQATRAEEHRRGAQDQAHRADENYRAARETVSKMLQRVRAPAWNQVPRIRGLVRGQLEDALAFYSRIALQPESGQLVRQDVARSCLDAGMIQIALNRYADGQATLQRGLAVSEDLVRRFPADQPCRELLAEALLLAGGNSRNRKEGLRLVERGVGEWETLVARHPESGNLAFRLALSQSSLGAGYYNHGRFAESLRCLFRANELLSSRGSENEGAMAINRLNLVRVYYQLKQPNRAQRQHALAEAEFDRAVSRHPQDRDTLDGLVVLRINHGEELIHGGKYAEALEYVSRNLPLLESLQRKEPEDVGIRLRLHATYGVQAKALDNLQRFAEAAQAYEKCTALAPRDRLEYFRLDVIRLWLRAGNYRRAGEIADLVAAAGAKKADLSIFQQLWELEAAIAMAARQDITVPESERTAFADRYENASWMSLVQATKLNVKKLLKPGPPGKPR